MARYQTHSIRLPSTMMKALKAAAEMEHRSFNGQLIFLLEKHLRLLHSEAAKHPDGQDLD